MTGKWLSHLLLGGLLLATVTGWVVVAACSQPTEMASPVRAAPRWVRTADGWERADWQNRRPRQLHLPPIHPALATAGIACAALAALVGSKRFPTRL